MKSTLLLALTSCAMAHLASGASIVHRYSFEDGSELLDSGSGNTGILANGATVSGGALQLTGLGSGTAGNHMTFTTTVGMGSNFGATGVTIESWYTDSGTGTWGKLFQFGDNTAGQEIGYTHIRGGGQSGVDRDGAQEFAPISVGSEHHLVITVASDGNLNTWIDGTQLLTNVDTNDLSNVTSTFEAIGATSWGDPGMNGSVNEFRIWSGELSAAEVATNLVAGPNATIPEPSGLALTLVAGLMAFRRHRS